MRPGVRKCHRSGSSPIVGRSVRSAGRPGSKGGPVGPVPGCGRGGRRPGRPSPDHLLPGGRYRDGGRAGRRGGRRLRPRRAGDPQAPAGPAGGDGRVTCHVPDPGLQYATIGRRGRTIAIGETRLALSVILSCPVSRSRFTAPKVATGDDHCQRHRCGEHCRWCLDRAGDVRIIRAATGFLVAAVPSGHQRCSASRS